MIYCPGEIEQDESFQRVESSPRSVVAGRNYERREVRGVGRGITVDRHDGGRIRLTNNSCNVWPCFTTWHLTGSLLRPRLPLPQEQFAPREPASNPLSRMINHSSTLKATLFAPPNQGVRDLCRSSPCDGTHSSGPARSRFVLRVRPPGRRVDRPQGRRVR